jgi:hypothetical protein
MSVPTLRIPGRVTCLPPRTSRHNMRNKHNRCFGRCGCFAFWQGKAKRGNKKRWPSRSMARGMNARTPPKITRRLRNLAPRPAKPAHVCAHLSKRNGFEALLKPPSGRFGRLQRQCYRVFIAHNGAVLTQQMLRWCYPRGENPPRWRYRNMNRAARSLGAHAMERVGAQRMWRIGSNNGSKGTKRK